MYENVHDVYLESRVLSADPMELVKLLYHAAVDSVRDARRHLAGHDIAGRSRSITKTLRILNELNSSLDHERGGDLSAGMARLYEYMTHQLLDANQRQIDAPLEEVLGLLLTMLEGWEGAQAAVLPQSVPEPKHQNQWETLPQPPAPEPVTYGAHAWSF